jgi:hypothetical protein
MTTRQRIEAWFKEEMELLIAKGATSQDLEEKAFEEFLADNSAYAISAKFSLTPNSERKSSV